MRKTLLYFLLLFAFGINYSYSTVCAAEIQKNDYCYYEITNEGVRILEYFGGDAFVPSEIDDMPVTILGYRSFWSLAGGTEDKIIIPNGVERIESQAFIGLLTGYCTDITIPASVIEIGSQAFGYTLVWNDDMWAEDELISLKLNDITIRGYTGTVAEYYAIENGFTFIALDDDLDTTTTTTTTDVTTTTTETTTGSTETITETTTTSDEESTATTTKSETTSLTSDTTTEINSSTTTITTTVVTTDEAETTDSIENITATTETTTTAITHIVSDEELCDWAVKDYEEKTGVTPASAEIEYTADDTAIITMIDAEGNILDVYTIDPTTGTGTESDGGEVNLPQTGYSNWYHTTAALTACVTVIGGVMVIGSGVLKKKR